MFTAWQQALRRFLEAGCWIGPANDNETIVGAAGAGVPIELPAGSGAAGGVGKGEAEGEGGGDTGTGLLGGRGVDGDALAI